MPIDKTIPYIIDKGRAVVSNEPVLGLVEPFVMTGLTDRPHLGCAMLIASCQKEGIKTVLIKGQTRYLKDMFINNSEELWHLITELKNHEVKKIGIANFKKVIKERGIKFFQDELKKIYQYFITDRDPRHYFDAKALAKFSHYFNIFARVYLYYLGELNYHKLSIVDNCVSQLAKVNPSCVGFSLQIEFDPLSRIIRQRLKKEYGLPIIIGGALTPHIDFKKLKKLFKTQALDYLVIGTAEETLPLLVEELRKGKEPKEIPNIFYESNGRIKGRFSRTEAILDNLPFPDFSQFDLDLYLPPKKILPLQTSRGCSWKKCAFCSHSLLYSGSYKVFSPKRVIEIINHLKNTYGCSDFVLHDEELPSAWAKKISDTILKRKLKDISLYALARLTTGFNNNGLLAKMRKAGFSTIAWGMESGCQKTLDSMSKGTSLPIMREILKKSSKNKITNLCFVMFGFPGETEKNAEQTVQFIRKNARYINGVMNGTFVFTANSPIGKDTAKWGLKIINKYKYVVKAGMDQKEADQFFNKFISQLNLNKLKIPSKGLLYTAPPYIRILYFLSANQGFLPNPVSQNMLSKNKLHNLYPIVLGEVAKKGEQVMFYPINTQENLYINQCYPEKEKPLSILEEKLYNLSNGILSIEDMERKALGEFADRYSEKFIREKCMSFFQEVFRKNWGIAFEKPWLP